MEVLLWMNWWLIDWFNVWDRVLVCRLAFDWWSSWFLLLNAGMTGLLSPNSGSCMYCLLVFSHLRTPCSFPRSLIGLFVHLCLTFWVLYIFWILILHQEMVGKDFLQSTGCLFSLSTIFPVCRLSSLIVHIAFAWQEFLASCDPICQLLLLCPELIVLDHVCSLPTLLSGRFRSRLTLRSVVHFELISYSKPRL